MVSTEISVTDKFSIKKLKDSYVVGWSFHYSEQLLFKKIEKDVIKKAMATNRYQALGFALALNNPNDLEILWLGGDYINVKNESYVEWLQDMYVIRGIAFIKHDDANDFKVWLEKKYMWSLLLS